MLIYLIKDIVNCFLFFVFFGWVIQASKCFQDFHGSSRSIHPDSLSYVCCLPSSRKNLLENLSITGSLAHSSSVHLYETFC
ncbi:hypothetical protein B0H65DRAFT_480330 [Neurospora tetraspora]|uniref:Uncharacterized protein n=1 Tax=Neurospora tetraspora TaxID=94610 RepID=A0AAE0MJI3_9PEZI|nr:hypothetical protein B0H65DRAFT_480330 [Neurospora tetraspora]